MFWSRCTSILWKSIKEKYKVTLKPHAFMRDHLSMSLSGELQCFPLKSIAEFPRSPIQTQQLIDGTATTIIGCFSLMPVNGFKLFDRL